MGKTYKDSREYKSTPTKQKPKKNYKRQEDLYFYLGNTNTREDHVLLNNRNKA